MFVVCVPKEMDVMQCPGILMAQYAHLPIYIKTYEFIKLNYVVVRQFRRE